MTKIKLFTLMLIFVVGIQSNFRPQSPVRILTRKVSTVTSDDIFKNAFCTGCGYLSKSCNNSLNKISKLAETDHFTLESIQNNKHGISESNLSIGTVNVSCSFPNRELINKKMDYILYMPISKTKILEGVIVYFHRTLFGVKEVPTSSSDQIGAIAGLYTSSAYAVLFVNYLGYDALDQYPHPYVQHPTCHVQSAIIALNHALEKLRAEFPSVNKFKLFTAGYSEGASYALWLEKCLEKPQSCGNVELDSTYEYRAAAAMSGPYDLDNIFKQFLIDQVQRLPPKNNTYQIESQESTNFEKAPLVAMTIMSHIFYSQGMRYYQQKINKDFWKMKCTRQSDQQKCKVNGYQFNNILEVTKSYEDSSAISQSIAYSAFGKKFNTSNISYLQAYRFFYETHASNSIYGLTDRQLINSHLFQETIRNASAINNVPKNNVFLFTLKRDSIISPNNTFNYIKAHKSTGRVSSYIFENSLYELCTLNQKVTASVDHNNGQVLANIFALSFIKINTQQSK